jgi:hypothetical protein
MHGEIHGFSLGLKEMPLDISAGGVGLEESDDDENNDNVTTGDLAAISSGAGNDGLLEFNLA